MSDTELQKRVKQIEDVLFAMAFNKPIGCDNDGRLKSLIGLQPVADASRDWQPIATAPKDGRALLLCRWDREYQWIIAGRWVTDWPGPAWAKIGTGERYKPTHWMLLPKGPKP